MKDWPCILETECSTCDAVNCGNRRANLSREYLDPPSSEQLMQTFLCGSCRAPVKTHWKYCQECKASLSAVGMIPAFSPLTKEESDRITRCWNCPACPIKVDPQKEISNMITRVTYQVERSPDPLSNKLMRALDFFEKGAGISITEQMVVTWKEGEVVDQARADRAGEAIKKSLETLGYDCFSVKQVGEPEHV